MNTRSEYMNTRSESVQGPGSLLWPHRESCMCARHPQGASRRVICRQRGQQVQSRGMSRGSLLSRISHFRCISAGVVSLLQLVPCQSLTLFGFNVLFFVLFGFNIIFYVMIYLCFCNIIFMLRYISVSVNLGHFVDPGNNAHMCDHRPT